MSKLGSPKEPSSIALSPWTVFLSVDSNEDPGARDIVPLSETHVEFCWDSPSISANAIHIHQLFRQKGKQQQKQREIRNKNVFSQKEVMAFDRVHTLHPSDIAVAQQVIADVTESAVDALFSGISSIIIGAGTSIYKQHAIIGTPEAPGTVPRVCDWLFERLATQPLQVQRDTRIHTSFIAVQNDNVFDLCDVQSGSVTVLPSGVLKGAVERLSQTRDDALDTLDEGLESHRQLLEAGEVTEGSYSLFFTLYYTDGKSIAARIRVVLLLPIFLLPTHIRKTLADMFSKLSSESSEIPNKNQRRALLDQLNDTPVTTSPTTNTISSSSDAHPVIRLLAEALSGGPTQAALLMCLTAELSDVSACEVEFARGVQWIHNTQARSKGLSSWTRERKLARIIIPPNPNLLPIGWEEKLCADGMVYFVDLVDKVTQWTDPRGHPAPGDDLSYAPPSFKQSQYEPEPPMAIVLIPPGEEASPELLLTSKTIKTPMDLDPKAVHSLSGNEGEPTENWETPNIFTAFMVTSPMSTLSTDEQYGESLMEWSFNEESDAPLGQSQDELKHLELGSDDDIEELVLTFEQRILNERELKKQLRKADKKIYLQKKLQSEMEQAHSEQIKALQNRLKEVEANNARLVRLNTRSSSPLAQTRSPVDSPSDKTTDTDVQASHENRLTRRLRESEKKTAQLEDIIRHYRRSVVKMQTPRFTESENYSSSARYRSIGLQNDTWLTTRLLEQNDTLNQTVRDASFKVGVSLRGPRDLTYEAMVDSGIKNISKLAHRCLELEDRIDLIHDKQKVVQQQQREYYAKRLADSLQQFSIKQKTIIQRMYQQFMQSSRIQPKPKMLSAVTQTDPSFRSIVARRVRSFERDSKPNSTPPLLSLMDALQRRSKMTDSH